MSTSKVFSTTSLLRCLYLTHLLCKFATIEYSLTILSRSFLIDALSSLHKDDVISHLTEDKLDLLHANLFKALLTPGVIKDSKMEGLELLEKVSVIAIMIGERGKKVHEIRIEITFHDTYFKVSKCQNVTWN